MYYRQFIRSFAFICKAVHFYALPSGPLPYYSPSRQATRFHNPSPPSHPPQHHNHIIKYTYVCGRPCVPPEHAYTLTRALCASDATRGGKPPSSGARVPRVDTPRTACATPGIAGRWSTSASSNYMCDRVAAFDSPKLPRKLSAHPPSPPAQTACTAHSQPGRRASPVAFAIQTAWGGCV